MIFSSASIATESAAGATAGVVGTVLGYPFDVLKTRMQVANLGLVSTARLIYNESGAVGFYRGVLSPLLALTLLNTMNFSAYANYKQMLMKYTDAMNTTEGKQSFGHLDWRISIAGAAVGPLASIISTPFELIKTQMQLLKKNSAQLSSAEKLPTNSLEMSYRICGLRGGVVNLYKGHAVNTVREIVFLSTYFTIYEHSKTALLVLTKQQLSGSIAVPFAGGIAGAIGWFISFPLDCIKSHIQSVPMLAVSGGNTTNAVQKSAWFVARDLLRRHGIMGLYSGVLPSILRAFLVSSSRFSAYEGVLWLLHQA